MPAPTVITAEGCFTSDIRNALNTNFSNVAAGNVPANTFPAINASNFVSLLVNGAVPITNPLTPTTFQINKAGVLADTLAAPVAVTDDGKMIWIVSNTANAHTITATGLYQSGSAAVNLATYAAFAGAGMQLMALNAKWVVVSSVGVTFS